MNAATEVSRLLDTSGAVLVRQSNHLVYRLPNGQNFVAAKTSSDPVRAAKNNLSLLRRALGIGRQTQNPEGGKSAMPIQETAAASSEMAGGPLSGAPGAESLKARIEAAIGMEEAEQERLLAEAQAHERRVQMLKALLPFAEEAMAEVALRAILPHTEPTAAAMPETPPEPPQQITDRVQVTRQLVFAATQTFDGTFTVNDVMALMTGDRQIDARERLRIRSSIAQSFTTLFERGELARESEGYGKRQAVWRKAALKAAAGIGV
jgi:hypothetical protein